MISLKRVLDVCASTPYYPMISYIHTHFLCALLRLAATADQLYYVVTSRRTRYLKDATFVRRGLRS